MNLENLLPRFVACQAYALFVKEERCIIVLTRDESPVEFLTRVSSVLESAPSLECILDTSCSSLLLRGSSVLGALSETFGDLYEDALQIIKSGSFSTLTFPGVSHERITEQSPSSLAPRLSTTNGESLFKGVHPLSFDLINPPIPSQDERTALFAASAYLGQQGRFSEALPLIRRYLDTDRFSADGMLILALCEGQLGFHQEAVTSLQALLDLHPEHDQARTLMSEFERYVPFIEKRK